MKTREFMLWMGLGLAAGCYAGVDDGEEADFDRTRGACAYAGSNGESSSYAWNCDNGDSRSAVVQASPSLAARPGEMAGPLEDAILQNAGDLMGGIIADCLSDPEFGANCTTACAGLGLGWQPDPGVCTEEMDVQAHIEGPLDDDPDGGVCPNGQPRVGGIVVAQAPCMCQCEGPLEGPGGDGNNQPPPPPPNGPNLPPGA